MTESNTVLQEIDTVTPKWTVPQQRSLLGAFLFSDNDSIEKQVRVLSGGEKARLALAKMLVAPEALLCLDEPTNTWTSTRWTCSRTPCKTSPAPSC